MASGASAGIAEASGRVLAFGNYSVSDAGVERAVRAVPARAPVGARHPTNATSPASLPRDAAVPTAMDFMMLQSCGRAAQKAGELLKENGQLVPA